MDAILIAGGHAPRRLAETAGHSRKSLFTFGGMPLVQHGARALLNAGLSQVAVVGSELLMEALPVDLKRVFFTTEGRDPVDNLLRGAERLGLGPNNRFFTQCGRSSYDHSTGRSRSISPRRSKRRHRSGLGI